MLAIVFHSLLHFLTNLTQLKAQYLFMGLIRTLAIVYPTLFSISPRMYFKHFL